MQTTERNESYTDKGSYAVMTRTASLMGEPLGRFTIDFCQNHESALFAKGLPAAEDLRVVETSLGWSYLVPALIRVEFGNESTPL